MDDDDLNFGSEIDTYVDDEGRDQSEGEDVEIDMYIDDEGDEEDDDSDRPRQSGAGSSTDESADVAAARRRSKDLRDQARAFLRAYSGDRPTAPPDDSDDAEGADPPQERRRISREPELPPELPRAPSAYGASDSSPRGYDAPPSPAPDSRRMARRFGSSGGPAGAASASSPLRARVPDRDRDSVARDKERLQRFHSEAMSFLSKAYNNDSTLIVEDRFDNPSSPSAPARDKYGTDDDFRAKRRVDLDKARLERFHAQAVSFLDRAYADEPGLLVTEEDLSPNATSAATEAAHRLDDAVIIEQDRKMLEQFHQEAMSFLDAAASNDLSVLVDDSGVNTPRRMSLTSGSGLSPSDRRNDRTSLRIARDKERLEQHYKDTMSFLNRAEMGAKGALVEEQELEVDTVERYQLQKYAREAMSFLDKAFGGDDSVLVDDGECEVPTPEVNDSRQSAPVLLSSHSDGSSRDGGNDLSGGEEASIAVDRAALERYEEEFGEFLSRAYQDDSTLIVEDADSETSGAERGLYARRMANSTTNTSASAENSYSESRAVDDERYSEDAFTDDEFQDPVVTDKSRLEQLQRALPQTPISQSSGLGSVLSPHVSRHIYHGDGGRSRVRQNMERYEREAADFLDGANVSEEETEDDEEREGDGEERQASLADLDVARTPEFSGRDMVGTPTGYAGDDDLGEDRQVDDDDFGADLEIVEDAAAQGGEEGETCSPSSTLEPKPGFSSFRAKMISPALNDSPLTPELMSANATPLAASMPTSLSGKDLLVDLILEDNSGKSHEWSEMPLERSFYRQLPRGATIKIRPRGPPAEGSMSGGNPGLMGVDPRVGHAAVSFTEFARVQNERDVALASLEEIVNERSMLAAQLSGMKSFMAGASPSDGSGDGGVVRSSPSQHSEIDLAAEVSEAYATMNKMIEEMDATMVVLDEKHQKSALRAEAAEYRSTELEADILKLRREMDMHLKSAALGTADLGRISAELKNTKSALADAEAAVMLAERRADELQRVCADMEDAKHRTVELEKQVTDLRDENTAGRAFVGEKSVKEKQKLQSELRSVRSALAEAEAAMMMAERRGGELRRTSNEELETANLRNKELEKQLADLRDELLLGREKADEQSETEKHALQNDLSSAKRDLESVRSRLAEVEKDLQHERRGRDEGAISAAAHVRAEKDKEIKNLVMQLERLGAEAREAASLRAETRRSRGEQERVLARLAALEEEQVTLARQEKEARIGQTAAEAESRALLVRYEDSLKARASNVNPTREMVELQAALHGLREEADVREKHLRLQLEDFRRRAEKAERDASLAEHNAEAAANAAIAAQEQSRLAVESERKARKSAEAEKTAMSMESRAWEKFAQQQMEKNARVEEHTEEIVKSSSKRGLRKSPSKNISRDASKKKRSPAGSGEEGGASTTKKKSPHRNFGIFG